LGLDDADLSSVQERRDLVHPDDIERLSAFIAALAPGVPHSLENLRVRDASGAYRWFDIDATDLHDHPEVAGLLLTLHDVSNRKALQDELAYRAVHDPITGLFNRTRFSEELEHLAAERPQRAFAVLFIDLYNFKPVNDSLGHEAGDRLLRIISQRLVHSVRTQDQSRPHDTICRIGGDEFAVLLLDATEEEARATAARLIDVIRRPAEVAGHEVQVGATIGIALSDAHGEHPETTVRRADLAMYEAKQAGRGQYAISPLPL
jgi:diguanylate cyclase (GGDEF)-like protein